MCFITVHVAGQIVFQVYLFLTKFDLSQLDDTCKTLVIIENNLISFISTFEG